MFTMLRAGTVMAVCAVTLARLHDQLSGRVLHRRKDDGPAVTGPGRGQGRLRDGQPHLEPPGPGQPDRRAASIPAPYGDYYSTTLRLAQQRRMGVWLWSVDTQDWMAEGSGSSYLVPGGAPRCP
jgi:hypothetical protein